MRNDDAGDRDRCRFRTHGLGRHGRVRTELELAHPFGGDEHPERVDLVGDARRGRRSVQGPVRRGRAHRRPGVRGHPARGLDDDGADFDDDGRFDDDDDDGDDNSGPGSQNLDPEASTRATPVATTTTTPAWSGGDDRGGDDIGDDHGATTTPVPAVGRRRLATRREP